MNRSSVGAVPNPDALLREMMLHYELQRFNNLYCQILDDGALSAWPDLFSDDCVYCINARENEDGGLPAGLVYCEGRGMLEDRAFAISRVAMYAPRTVRHYVTNQRVTEVVEGGGFRASANYLLMEILDDEPKATIHHTGVYRDRFIRDPSGALRLRERRCIYDSLIIPNSLVYPV